MISMSELDAFDATAVELQQLAVRMHAVSLPVTEATQTSGGGRVAERRTERCAADWRTLSLHLACRRKMRVEPKGDMTRSGGMAPRPGPAPSDDSWAPATLGMWAMRNLVLICLFVGVAGLWGCVANPRPDLPEDEGINNVDPTRVRVDIGAGHDRVLITGLQGAVDARSTGVQVHNLRSGDVTQVGVAPDGSFTAEVNAIPSQIFGLNARLGEVVSDTIYVGGNAEREAVPVGTDEECELLPEPTDDACLVCFFDGHEEIVGCALDDFTEEGVLNPANIAECLFLSTDVVELFPLEEPGFEDLRWGEINIFNGCGEPIIIELGGVETPVPDRFFVEPPPGVAIVVDPTFFGYIDVFYDGTQRFSDEPDEAFVTVNAFLPDEVQEFPLGTLGVSIIAW